MIKKTTTFINCYENNFRRSVYVDSRFFISRNFLKSFSIRLSKNFLNKFRCNFRRSVCVDNRFFISRNFLRSFSIKLSKNFLNKFRCLMSDVIFLYFNNYCEHFTLLRIFNIFNLKTSFKIIKHFYKRDMINVKLFFVF